MVLVVWLLFTALLLLVWLSVIVAVALLGVARLCELRGEGRLLPKRPPGPQFSASDAKFLTACGIGSGRSPAPSGQPMARRLQ